MPKVVFSWSGGKDSALALHALKKDPGYEILALLSTVTAGYNRLSMHGVRRTLLEAQVEALGYPLRVMEIPIDCTDEVYERLMGAEMLAFAAKGVTAAVFGDLFLDEIRSYREGRLGQIGLQALFPVWGRPTNALAKSFISLGFKAILVCVDTTLLDASFAGRDFDRRLLADLPEDVDPCGENGEFHTFVYDGPIFDQPLRVNRGELVLRDDRFMYCDLLSADGLES